MTTEPTPTLDDLEQMQSVDRRNMLRLINELPEQYETAMGIARSFAAEPLSTKPNVVFISGVGDSGLAAEMAAAALAEETDVPIVTGHGGRSPECVGEDSLVFVVDYAGKSQLTLRSYKEARLRRARVICVTSGGGLLEAATKDNVKTIRIMPGQPARTAVGYLFAPLVVAIERLGLTAGAAEKLSSAVRLLKNVRETFRFESPTARNLAKQTAQFLCGKMVGVYGSGDYRTAVASRWKNLINANTKTLAFTGVYPDITESEISGWEMAERQCKEFAIVFLRDPADKSDVTDLVDVSTELLDRFGLVQIEMRGGTTVEKMLYGTYLGDFVSYYLALLYGVDPTRTDNIAYVQARLAGEEPPE